jgi:CheY-like chemotaxis protein
MSVLVLVVDDEHDVADLFRQQFRRELRSGQFLMDFAHSGEEALERVALPSDLQLILLLSDINRPGMTGLELLPRLER